MVNWVERSAGRNSTVGWGEWNEPQRSQVFHP